MTSFADTLPPRQRALDDMLTHYSEVTCWLEKGGMGDGDGGYPWPPDVWEHSGYPTLEKLLRALRSEFEAEERWPPYWHIREWYFRCVTVRKPLMRTDKKGRKVQAILQGVPQFYLKRERYVGLPAEVKLMGEAQVRRGLAWIADGWPVGARFEPETLEDIVKRLERRVAA